MIFFKHYKEKNKETFIFTRARSLITMGIIFLPPLIGYLILKQIPNYNDPFFSERYPIVDGFFNISFICYLILLGIIFIDLMRIRFAESVATKILKHRNTTFKDQKGSEVWEIFK